MSLTVDDPAGRGRPSDRVTDRHVEYLDARLASADRWLARRQHFFRLIRALRWCLRRLGVVLGWFVDWWPKVWKALLGLASALVVSEQLGYPLAGWLGGRLAEIVSVVSGAS